MPPEDTVAVQSYSDCLELKGTFLSYMQDRKKKKESRNSHGLSKVMMEIKF